MNILDVSIWTTPLTKYYVLLYDFNSYTAIVHSGIDLETIKAKAEWVQYADSMISFIEHNIENIILSERYGDKLFSELEHSGVVIRFSGNKAMPRFHEEEWQKTNNIRGVK